MRKDNQLVVLTRSVAGNRAWAAHFASHDIPTYSLPAIETEAAAPSPGLKQAFEQLDQFAWLVFTSAAGVRYAHDLLSRSDANNLPAIAAVGEKTAAAVAQAGWHVAFQPSQPNAAALAEELPIANELPTKERGRILILRTNIASGELAKVLRQRGAEVTDLAVYQTRLLTGPDPDFSRLLNENRIRCITFASPSAVRGFARRVTPVDLTKAIPLPAIAIGPSVAAYLRQAGFADIHLAARPDVEAVLETVQQLLNKPL